MSKKKEKEFKQGELVKYIGTGFLSFDKSDPIAQFDCNDGPFDVYINYKGNRVLVYKYDIQAIEE